MEHADPRQKVTEARAIEAEIAPLDLRGRARPRNISEFCPVPFSEFSVEARIVRDHQDFTPSPTARRAQAGTGVRAQNTRKGAGVDTSRPCHVRRGPWRAAVAAVPCALRRIWLSADRRVRWRGPL